MKNKIIDNVLFIFFATVYVVYSILIPLYKPDLFTIKTDVIELTIPYGMSAKNIAERIKDAGIVKDSDLLIKWMVRLKIDRKLQPGKYKLHKSYELSVAHELRSAKPEIEQFMVIPGTKYETLVKIFIQKKADLFTKEILDNNNFPKEIRLWLPQDARTL